MCLSLDPVRLVEDPALHLQLILEIQQQMEHSLEHIKRATHILCPRNEIHLPRSDQHLQELKLFRLSFLEIPLRHLLWNEILELIHMSCDCLKEVGFPDSPFLLKYPNGFTQRDWTPQPYVLKTIDEAVEYMSQSELDLVQCQWPIRIREFDGILEKCGNLINGTLSTRRYKPRIRIAKALIPIIKMNRSLIRKLLKYYEKPVPFVTGMRSDQLHTLQILPTDVARSLEQFVWLLKYGSSPRKRLPEFTRILKTYYKSPLRIIMLQVSPLVSETRSFPGPNSCKTWLTTWRN